MYIFIGEILNTFIFFFWYKKKILTDISNLGQNRLKLAAWLNTNRDKFENIFLSMLMIQLFKQMVMCYTQWSWILKVDIYAALFWSGETRVISHPPHLDGWSKKLSWLLRLCRTKPGRCTSLLHSSEAPLWLKRKCWQPPACGQCCWTETGALGPVHSCKPVLYY